MPTDSIDAQISIVTNKYLHLKSQPSNKDARKEMTKVMNELGALFWQKMENIIINALDPTTGELNFKRSDLFVIDAGLLSEKLIEGNCQALQDSLFREFTEQGEANHYYLSELIKQRHHQFMVYEQMSESQEDVILAEDQKSNYRGMTVVRDKIYEKIKPWFMGLPGVSSEAATFITSGKLDNQIETLSGQYIETRSDDLLKKRNQLIQIRDKVLTQVKSRCKSPKELELIDGLTNLNNDIIKELIKAKTKEIKDKANVSEKKNAQMSIDKQLIEKSVSFLTKEVRLMKSLMSIGIISGGMIHAQYVLLADQQRTDKLRTAKIMNIVKEVDPRMPGNPDLVIAPYVGNGFFEWDHNSLIVSLTPVRAVEESVVSAVANYRILIDSLHNNNTLKKEYEAIFGEGTFRTNFPKDYQNWVLGIGSGKRSAMKPNALEFFKRHIGPSTDSIITPKELNSVSSTERQKLLSHLNSKILQGQKTFSNYYTLAVLNWQEADVRKAAELMEEAWKLNPKDGRTSFSAGALQKKIGRVQKAEGRFEACITDAPNTIWRLFAEEELSKISAKYRDLI